MALASPGVLVKEVDFTATVQVADQNIGVVCIDAERGPTDQVTYVASERELVEIFGGPNKYNYESWFAASTIIQYGGVVAVVRPAGEADLGLRNANIKDTGAADAALVIKNKDDYETKEVDSNIDFVWAARTSGTFMNGLKVAVIDHGADQRLTVSPAAGQVSAVDGETNVGVTAGRTEGNYTITATNGSGSGATFTVVVAADGSATVAVASGGSGYVDAETLTLPATGNYGGATDITVDVDGVGSALPAEGTYIQWDVTLGSITNTYKGNVYKTIDSDSIEVTLWDSTKRLGSTQVVKDVNGATLFTVSSIESNDVYSTLEYTSGRKWIALAPQPGTSPGVGERGGKFDEFHVAIIDTTGEISGTPNTVLETLTYLSKATDARSSEGTSIYWKKSITENSRYIYAGDESFLAAGDQLALAGQTGTASDIDKAQANAVFKLFSFGTGAATTSTNAKSLSGGTDYDYSTDSAIATVRAGIVTGYNLLEDPELFGDIDFLVPGYVSAEIAVRLIAIAEKRRDCIVAISPPRDKVVNSNTSTKKTDDIIDFFRGLPSTSYAIFDSGYKYIYDKYNDVYRYVPCGADIAGLCISTTNNAETWFSPAGYNRGQVRNATKLAYSPRQAERDRLYTNRINPVVAFPGQGIVLFGDKTALASPSAFDRINVRRLFIELEKNIAVFSKYQLFEINDELTRSAFRSAIEPYLRGVQGRRGIYDFLVVCDSSNNTGDVIDRNELLAEIYIKPARSINFITITFVATRTGVSFNELIA
jgi:phage tail sheath protein FI